MWRRKEAKNITALKVIQTLLNILIVFECFKVYMDHLCLEPRSHFSGLQDIFIGNEDFQVWLWELSTHHSTWTQHCMIPAAAIFLKIIQLLWYSMRQMAEILSYTFLNSRRRTDVAQCRLLRKITDQFPAAIKTKCYYIFSRTLSVVKLDLFVNQMTCSWLMLRLPSSLQCAGFKVLLFSYLCT